MRSTELTGDLPQSTNKFANWLIAGHLRHIEEDLACRVAAGLGHVKAIAVDKGGRVLVKMANVGQDAGVVDASDKDAFIAAAKTRQWIGKSPFEHRPSCLK